MTRREPPLLNVSAMARQLGVRASWLRDEADEGRVPAVRAGETYLFDPITVERVLRERARSGDQKGHTDVE